MQESKENSELSLALGFAEYTNRNIFLTGKAGTGKTTFLRNLKKRSHKRLIVTAPTGVAAINAGGVTLHSFFQLSFGPQVPEAIRENDYTHRFSKQKINIIRSMDLLIIDEISMVRADLLDAVDKVLRRFRHPQQPFGGVQLLMIGDLQQLAPVVKEDEKALLQKYYETPYFFSSLALRQTSYVSIELTHVYRQQDDVFIGILNKVRSNQMDTQSISILNSRYDPSFTPKEQDEYVTLCTHNAQADQINADRLAKLKGQSETYEAVIEGKFPELSYPTESKLTLKVGAQVMFCKNDTGSGIHRYYNGKIGRIKRLDKGGVEVECRGEDPIRVEPVKWENTRYEIDEKSKEIKEIVEGTFQQLPLKLAWAITIHKSQGLTFEHAIINAGQSFAHGQVYVALSRCKTLEGLVLLTPISRPNIITDRTIDQFIHHIETHVPTEHDLRDSRILFQRQLLSEINDYSDIEKPMNTMLDITKKNPSSFPQALTKQICKLSDTLREEVTGVAVRFSNQCQQLLKEELEIESNEKLLERLRNAAVYFSDKMEKIVRDGILSLSIEIDNKEVQKQQETQQRRIEEAYVVRAAVLGVLKEGFRTSEILNARAKALLKTEVPGMKGMRNNTIKRSERNNQATAHPKLFARLRAYRMAMADERNVSAFVIYTQKVLYALCEELPTTEKELRGIKGLGSAKIKAFGPDILEIIREYCDEEGIAYSNQMTTMEFVERQKSE